MVGRCPECEDGALEVEDILTMRMGFANKLKIKCINCNWEYGFYTSKKAD